MIKIIKEGIKHRIECRDCGCIYQYEKSDISKECWSMNEYHDIVPCPQCGEKNETWMFPKCD